MIDYSKGTMISTVGNKIVDLHIGDIVWVRDAYLPLCAYCEIIGFDHENSEVALLILAATPEFGGEFIYKDDLNWHQNTRQVLGGERITYANDSEDPKCPSDKIIFFEKKDLTGKKNLIDYGGTRVLNSRKELHPSIMIP